MRDNRYSKCLIALIAALLCAVAAPAQERKEQNKPYIDLRPLHFGILVGVNMQYADFKNKGPQTVVAEDGTTSTQTILCDNDAWNPGFSVGVLGELRLTEHLQLRIAPTMHFGAKHLKFINRDVMNEYGRPTEYTQDMKNTYISFPIDLKFGSKRFNNHRPYMTFGVNPMINLTGKDQDIIKLKRTDVALEVGMGCDFYLPFFKINPELKFIYGLGNALDQDHVNELQDKAMRPYANSVGSCSNRMICLTFYFE